VSVGQTEEAHVVDQPAGRMLQVGDAFYPLLQGSTRLVQTKGDLSRGGLI
jgi:hypothetical protein